MRTIDDFFYESPDTPLFHYTGIGTLEGVAATRQLWATAVSYMNDSKEIVHACEILIDVIQEKQSQWDLTDEYMRFTRQFLDWLDVFRNEIHNIFVFSLSAQRSLLSQWRGYTPHGKGVSIGFSTSLVREIATTNQMRLGKCIYDYPDQEVLVRSLIDKLWLSIYAQTELLPRPIYIPYFESNRSLVLQTLALLKHAAFREECEWRLISAEPTDLQQVHFRQGEGTALLLPYIKLELSKRSNLFDLVILGPTPHEALAESALDSFLAKHKLCGNVERSAIPFRKW
jgi:hypothetical protein